MDESDFKSIGIILTGSSNYEPSYDSWKEEILKVIKREVDKYIKKDGEKLKVSFIFPVEQYTTPLLRPLTRFIKSEEERSDLVDKVIFSTKAISLKKDYKNPFGKRDKEMCELANYCFSFTENKRDNKEGKHHFLLDLAKKENLIIREIYPQENE